MSFASPVNGSSVLRAARRISLFFAAAVVVGVFGLPTIARAAAPPAPGAPTFACVDRAKVYAGSKIKQTNEGTLQTMGAKYDATLKRLQLDVVMPGADLQTLAGLLVKDTPTDDDTKQITAFETKAKTDGDELNRIQQESDDKQTPDDKAKLASLTTEYQSGQTALQQVQQAFQDKMQQEESQLSDVAAAAIRAAIAKIAQKQNITVVFDSQVALYTPIDLTDQVTAEMAK